MTWGRISRVFSVCVRRSEPNQEFSPSLDHAAEAVARQAAVDASYLALPSPFAWPCGQCFVGQVRPELRRTGAASAT